jgi:hypothetical protein
VRRRQQLKKRRDYRGNNSFMGVNAVAVTTGRRDREANAARVEALPSLTNVMKESTKAARRAMDRGKPPSMPADVEKGDQRKVRRPSRAGGNVLMEPLNLEGGHIRTRKCRRLIVDVSIETVESTLQSLVGGMRKLLVFSQVHRARSGRPLDDWIGGSCCLFRRLEWKLPLAEFSGL